MAIDWAKTPLIPVVTQDCATKEVLMLSYANRRAFELTLQSAYAHYFSRSRQRIWKKGEESGNFQKVQKVLIDCDGDALLYLVDQKGAACHTGHRSCFFTEAQSGTETESAIVDPSLLYNVVDRLFHTISERKRIDPSFSYVASLFNKGENAILKKVTEEAGELTLAIKDGKEEQIVYEAADLLFHTLIALASKNLPPDRIRAELARREGIGGITEKAQRKS
ncbi:MAG: bifunctional phosphoribosyl-AMP cyclohydrolase/phosphoribosyl-ATP diphosphatase HisIE [Helicobacteraceae bacterium]|jgi:phosphoribosyl-ATP pyrophosphohydrolase/phosphoribosyl-AMP cyclohydrolase|nr:bifunctional phosphoribosyl-AMP cyclohydrolase/phosphoribosyl-ATP diphosphatase HisIE [Helicobacteraceae bacterium]